LGARGKVVLDRRCCGTIGRSIRGGRPALYGLFFGASKSDVPPLWHVITSFGWLTAERIFRNFMRGGYFEIRSTSDAGASWSLWFWSDKLEF
jgi:hypothetical protein